MTNEQEMREALFACWDKDRNRAVILARIDDAYEIWDGFQAAYQLQQTTIDALMQNTESMSQTNGALSNRMAYYNDRNAELNANNRDLQTKLDKAVSALELLLEDTQHKNHDCLDPLCPVLNAQQTLLQLKESKMNRSDIMKAAELAKDFHENIINYRNGQSVELRADFMRKYLQALIAAAELLKQVEVVEAGEKAQEGDVIDLGEFGFAIVTAVSGNNIDCAMLRDGQLTSGYFFRNFGKYQIIQRAGKPVIVEKEGV